MRHSFSSAPRALHEAEESPAALVDRNAQIFPPRPMSDIDRQRISGVKLLESLGYVFRAGEWQGPAHSLDLTAEADLMHAMLVTRADALEGFTESSPEEAEYAAIAELVETYEAKRWPEGREPKGKG